MEKSAVCGAAESRTRMVVMTGVLAALVCVATMVIAIPAPTGGYLNLGDSVVLLGAYLLGPVYGAAAAGVGAALADLLVGAAAWAPGTLVIKAAMAALAALLYRRARRSALRVVLTGVAGEAVMVGGYWLFECWLLQSAAGAAAGIPGNLVQGAFGAAASTLLALTLRKSAYVRREFPAL